MDRLCRIPASTLIAADVPPEPGVYVWYSDERAVYIGKASNLRARVWNKHMGLGAVMTGSAFRRNVAEHLGIAKASDIKMRRYTPTEEEVRSVNMWIRRCSVAWKVSATRAAALELERHMKWEWMPPLTKA